MWSGYTPAVHRQTSISSPTAGTAGNVSPSSTYPPDQYQPRTPTQHAHQNQNHRKSLSRVEETVMEDDLVARDYAHTHIQKSVGQNGRGYGDGTGTETDGSSFRTMTPRRIGSVVSPEHQREGEEGFIPPKSIHDDYLAQFIDPIRSAGSSTDLNTGNQGQTSRPAALRSTSTPAPNILTSPISLITKASAVPLRGLGLAPAEIAENGGGRGKPIFEIFNAELSQGSEGMVKALKGHLEDVLRVQEEIGRMHLELEGLGEGRRGSDQEGRRESAISSKGSPAKGMEGSPGKLSKGDKNREGGGEKVEDALDKREKGVDELMERLSILSNNLRTYHELGTPKLSFSHSRSQSKALDPLSPNSPDLHPPTLNRQHSAQPDFFGLTTSPTPMSPSPPRADTTRNLPLRNPVAVHKGIDDLRRQEGLPSMRSNLNQSHATGSGSGFGSPHEEVGMVHGLNFSPKHRSSVNSDLPPLRLPVDDYDYENEHEHESYEGKTIKKKQSASFWDLEALRREKGSDNWVEHEHDVAPDEFPGGGVGRSGMGRGRGKKFDSPIEMVDRTRPW